MIKVILIEDRIERQKKLLGSKLNELKEIPFLKNISGGTDFADIKGKIIEKNFSFLDDYEIVMLHRSAFDSEIRNSLLNYLKEYPKKLVLFSGGITGCQISKLKNLEFMLLNVTEFYSENLLLFLKNNAINLLELAFGEKWETSLLIDAIEKLTLYEKAYKSEKPFFRIESDLEINNLHLNEFFLELKSGESKVSKEQLKNILTRMKAKLISIL